MSSFFVFCSINTFVMGSVSFVFDCYINDTLSLCVVFDCDVSNGHFLCFVFDCTLIMLCCLVMFDYANLSYCHLTWVGTGESLSACKKNITIKQKNSCCKVDQPPLY